MAGGESVDTPRSSRFRKSWNYDFYDLFLALCTLTDWLAYKNEKIRKIRYCFCLTYKDYAFKFIYLGPLSSSRNVRANHGRLIQWFEANLPYSMNCSPSLHINIIESKRGEFIGCMVFKRRFFWLKSGQIIHITPLQIIIITYYIICTCNSSLKTWNIQCIDIV